MIGWTRWKDGQPGSVIVRWDKVAKSKCVKSARNKSEEAHLHEGLSFEYRPKLQIYVEIDLCIFGELDACRPLRSSWPCQLHLGLFG